jgi:excisionase family DNA binding protein
VVARSEDGERLLTIGQAAARLGVSVATLRAWADKGLVSVVRLPSGYRRFTPAEIAARRREMGLDGE